MKLSGTSICGSLAVVFAVGLAQKSQAAPIELFHGASVDGTMPEQIIASYKFGRGGMFVSSDAGKDFKLLCTSAIDPMLQLDSPRVSLNAGAIYVAVFGGVWRGDPDGCNFVSVPELNGRYVSDVAGDPIDAKRTYVVTSDGTPGLKNGIYMNDAGVGPAFTALGTQEELFVNTLHVVKNASGRRFYETAVKTDTETNLLTYSARVSDDDAKTWISYALRLEQFGPQDNVAEFSIVAVDPQNADHLIGRVRRDQRVDSVLDSPDQGKTWTLLTEINDFQAVAFTPDGKLYLGDNDQSSPGLFLIEKRGAAPKRLSDQWKVGCLQYDAPRQRMLACNDYRFGSADLDSGAFTIALDMRCATSFVDCPGSVSVRDVCQTQLEAYYCGVTHYPAAPLCAGYDQGPDAQQFLQSLDFTCQNGLVIAKPNDAQAAGSGAAGMTLVTGAAGGGAAAGAPVTAPSTAAGGGGSSGGTSSAAAAGGGGPTSTTTPPRSSHGGCAAASAHQDAEPAPAAWLAAIGLLALTRGRRRR